VSSILCDWHSVWQRAWSWYALHCGSDFGQRSTTYWQPREDARSSYCVILCRAVFMFKIGKYLLKRI
jgi:hypothetical protein